MSFPVDGSRVDVLYVADCYAKISRPSLLRHKHKMPPRIKTYDMGQTVTVPIPKGFDQATVRARLTSICEGYAIDVREKISRGKVKEIYATHVRPVGLKVVPENFTDDE
ncbi:MAG: hypothetical protein Q7T11_08715 [Deltaproteobacteria bacterium]|nr:hypothetical protein [Deltaproteobacteria bacterium]